MIIKFACNSERSRAYPLLGMPKPVRSGPRTRGSSSSTLSRETPRPAIWSREAVAFVKSGGVARAEASEAECAPFISTMIQQCRFNCWWSTRRARLDDLTPGQITERALQRRSTSL